MSDDGETALLLKQLWLHASSPSLGTDASLLLSTPRFLKGFPGNRLEGPIWRSDAQQRPGFSILHAPFEASHPKQERLGSCWAGGPGNVVQSSAAVTEAAAFRCGQSSPGSARWLTDLRGACLEKWTPELLPNSVKLKKKDDLCVNEMLVYLIVLQFCVLRFIALLGYNNSHVIDTHDIKDIEDTEDTDNIYNMDNKDKNTHSPRFYKQPPWHFILCYAPKIQNSARIKSSCISKIQV